MGAVGLAEYVCTHPLHNFYRGRSRLYSRKTLSRGFILHPTLPVDRVTRRKLRMAQDSDDLFVVHVLVWVLVVVLAIVALHCLLPRRVVR